MYSKWVLFCGFWWARQRECGVAERGRGGSEVLVGAIKKRFECSRLEFFYERDGGAIPLHVRQTQNISNPLHNQSQNHSFHTKLPPKLSQTHLSTKIICPTITLTNKTTHVLLKIKRMLHTPNISSLHFLLNRQRSTFQTYLPLNLQIPLPLLAPAAFRSYTSPPTLPSPSHTSTTLRFHTHIHTASSPRSWLPLLLRTPLHYHLSSHSHSPTLPDALTTSLPTSPTQPPYSQHPPHEPM